MIDCWREFFAFLVFVSRDCQGLVWLVSLLGYYFRGVLFLANCLAGLQERRAQLGVAKRSLFALIVDAVLLAVHSCKGTIGPAGI